ncbi:MAG: ESX secretion-associated protein EspG [Nocardia sp.]|nr:ESX secretion-associated protein EspG [Nocardia sp.]
MSWEFTPDEFLHVWQETDLDRLPFPLQLRSSLAWRSDYEKLCWDLRTRMPPGFDPRLSAALRAVAKPEMSLLLTGTRKQPVRIFAGTSEGYGATLVQRPGRTEEFGGNVVVEFGSPTVIPRVFASVLGKIPAGCHPALIESLDTIELSLESWTGTKETTTDRMRKLLSQPRIGMGHIEVRCGLHDPRPHPPQYLSWFDVEHDGRYTYRQHYSDFRIDPASAESISAEITRMMRVQEGFSESY